MKKLLSLAAAAMTVTAAMVGPSSTTLADTDSTSYLLSCSFESGEDGWTGRGDASVESSSKTSFDGSNALYCTNRSDSWNGAAISFDDSYAGETLSFSTNVKYESGRDTALYHFTMQYNDGSETKYEKIASANIIKGEWAQLANPSFTVPANSSEISIYVETATGTSDFYVDDVKVAAEGTVIEGENGGKYIPGDIFPDGVVDTFDLICARKLIVASDQPAPQSINADVDKSKEFAVNDLVLLDEFISGKITEFPENIPVEEVTPFDYEANKQFKEAPGDYFNPCQQQGKVTQENYSSIRGNKTLYVYTPYNYDPEKKYNIFYLMHGGGENEKTLFFQDDTMIQNMLDHMIMNGELEPLIVVTPTFNGQGGEAANFYEELRANVIPFVEGKYSTYAESTSEEDIRASRMHRAYGGFSMGSVSTWQVFKNDIDLVGYFMPLSGDHWGGNGAYGKAKDLADAVDRSGFTDRQYFIFAATGSDDIAYPNVNPQVDEMKKMSQFKFTSDFSEGNFYFMVAPGKTHWWGYVRHYVYDALPYFFHETGE